jgi:hypothetical protein
VDIEGWPVSTTRFAKSTLFFPARRLGERRKLEEGSRDQLGGGPCLPTTRTTVLLQRHQWKNGNADRRSASFIGQTQTSIYRMLYRRHFLHSLPLATTWGNARPTAGIKLEVLETQHLCNGRNIVWII